MDTHNIHEESGVQQYLTFVLGGKDYALSIAGVKEIIEYRETTEVPMTPDFISGVINLRGCVVPVVDICQRFIGRPTKHTKRTSIVITEIASEDLQIEIGIIVDIVNEVLDIDSRDIEPAPKMGDQIQTSFISGMAKVDGKFLILLNVEKVFSIEDLSLVGGMQEAIKS